MLCAPRSPAGQIQAEGETTGVLYTSHLLCTKCRPYHPSHAASHKSVALPSSSLGVLFLLASVINSNKCSDLITDTSFVRVWIWGARGAASDAPPFVFDVQQHLHMAGCVRVVHESVFIRLVLKVQKGAACVSFEKCFYMKSKMYTSEIIKNKKFRLNTHTFSR